MHQVDSFMPPDSKVQRCLRNDESRSSARRWDMDTSHSPTSEEYIEQRMEGFWGGSKMMVETCWDTSHQSINDKVTVYKWHIFCMHVCMLLWMNAWNYNCMIPLGVHRTSWFSQNGWMDGWTHMKQNINIYLHIPYRKTTLTNDDQTVTSHWNSHLHLHLTKSEIPPVRLANLSVFGQII